jgi:hypothetical protein
MSWSKVNFEVEQTIAYPGEINSPGRYVKVCEIVDNLALEETLGVVDHDALSCVDDLDEAKAEIRDSCVEWFVVGDPALEIVHGICAIPSDVLSMRWVSGEQAGLRCHEQK